MPFKPMYSFDLVVLGEESDSRLLCQSLQKLGHQVRGYQEQGEACFHPGSTEPYSLQQACAEADMLLCRLDKESMRHLSYAMGDLRLKIVLDLSSLTILPRVPFRRSRIPIHNGYQLLNTITGCQHLVKAFPPTGYESLLDPGIPEADLIIAGASFKAKQVARLLFQEWHYSRIYDIGGLGMIRAMDGLLAYGQDREATPEA